MAHSVTDIRTAIAEILNDTLDGVTTYPRVPSQITAPAIIVRPESGTRMAMGRGVVSYTYRLIVCAASPDAVSGQDVLDAMLSTVGDRSVFAAIDTERDLGLTDTDASADGWSNYGVTEVAGNDYLTADIALTVHTPGV